MSMATSSDKLQNNQELPNNPKKEFERYVHLWRRQLEGLVPTLCCPSHFR